jgi:hypothetical protein
MTDDHMDGSFEESEYRLWAGSDAGCVQRTFSVPNRFTSALNADGCFAQVNALHGISENLANHGNDRLFPKITSLRKCPAPAAVVYSWWMFQVTNPKSCVHCVALRLPNSSSAELTRST